MSGLYQATCQVMKLVILLFTCNFTLAGKYLNSHSNLHLLPYFMKTVQTIIYTGVPIKQCYFTRQRLFKYGGIIFCCIQISFVAFWIKKKIILKPRPVLIRLQLGTDKHNLNRNKNAQTDNQNKDRNGKDNDDKKNNFNITILISIIPPLAQHRTVPIHSTPSRKQKNLIGGGQDSIYQIIKDLVIV